MKIFFSVSIRGAGEHAKLYPQIINVLSKYGEVLTEFNPENQDKYADASLKTEEIYKRDTTLLAQSDIVVADVTIPSLGVGYEIEYAETLKKPIICLYMPMEGGNLSAMIKGNPNIRVCEYKNIQDVETILNEILRSKE